MTMTNLRHVAITVTMLASVNPAAAQLRSVQTSVTVSTPAGGRISETGQPQTFNDSIFSFSDNSAYNVTTYAEASVGMVRALAVQFANPANLAGLQPVDFSQFEGVFDTVAGAYTVQPLDQTANASAFVSDPVTPSVSSRVTLNLYFDRQINLNYALDPQVFGQFAAAFRAANSADAFPFRYGGSGISASATLAVAERLSSSFARETVQPISTADFSVFPGFLETGFPDDSVFVVQGFGSDRLRRISQPGDGSLIDSYEEGPDLGAFGPRQTAANYTLDYEFIAGREYRIELGANCGVGTFGAANFVAGNSASCDAGNSGYWNGLTNITDLNGNPLSDFSLIGASGFNYRNASPFSPAPATDVTGVPEPDQWALFVVGFGLAGVVLRRRHLPAQS